MKILMPIDGSIYSEAALAFIAGRITLIKLQPEIELVNVQHAVSDRVARAAGGDLVQHYQSSESNKVLEPAVDRLKHAGLRAHATALVGRAGALLSRLATDDAMDLIIMGSHGHTGLKNLLFGSVTQTVMAACSTPMLVLREDTVPKNDSLKVGIALDGSDYALAVVRFLLKNRALFGAQPLFTLVHVVPDLLTLVVPGFGGGAPVSGFTAEQASAMHLAAIERAFGPARALFKAADLEFAQAQLVDNHPGDAIASYAMKNQLDLVAMGSHGEGKLQSAMLGSVATRVAAKCGTALLFIKASNALPHGYAARVDHVFTSLINEVS